MENITSVMTKIESLKMTKQVHYTIKKINLRELQKESMLQKIKTTSTNVDRKKVFKKPKKMREIPSETKKINY